MNKFYLPQIKKVTITDYNLYNCPLTIDFSSKLNVVYGTNGTGKSTLLMIILFSIIGPYRGGIKTTTRSDKRKDSRPFYVEDFFKDRTIVESQDAKVKSEFIIHNDEYIVEHSLDDGKLLNVLINGKALDGKLVSYRTFESKFTRTRELADKDDSDLVGYLIYNYQNAIKVSTGLPGGVNTLISMLLDVMFFDEGRKFTFWDSDLQETVIGKYIVDKDFYELYLERKLDTKSFESAYKKKSETLNFMKKFLENEKEDKSEKNKETIDETELRLKLIEIEGEIEKLINKSQDLQLDYSKKSEKSMNLLSEIEKTQENITKLEETWYNNLFPSQYNLYRIRFSSKMLENVCPICGKHHEFSMDTKKCIFCNEQLDITLSPDLVEVDIERKNQQMLLTKKNAEMDLQKNILNKLKLEISKIKKEIDEKSILKNQMEVNLNPTNNLLEDNDTKRLDKARQDRDEALKIFNESKSEEEKMKIIIESSLVDNFREFSSSFIKYSKSFFGNNHVVKLSLPFNDEEKIDELMIKFQLDGKNRDESYMLSESQRIFTDLSFRFAVLTTFHERSFFMCETPDSTLDVFHENNAVQTFKEYINMGNTLILTANARRSNLVSELFKEYGKSEVNVVDLTKLSKLALSEEMTFDKYLGGLH